MHLPFKNLNEESLYAAISKVLEARMKSAAEKIALAIKTEADPVAAIIQKIEAYR